MIDNASSNKSFLNQITDLIKNNLRKIIIFLSVCFVFFLSYQIYSFYVSNKVKNNSISFYSTQNTEDTTFITETIKKLSNDKNFYGMLSKLELIKLNFENKNNKEAISLYLELISREDLNSIYKSAIASRAAYELTDLNFTDLSLNYITTINNFISFIDDTLIAYKGIKLELIYLTKILEVEKNNIKYTSFDEAIETYNNLINSDIASSIKERVNKIHEFYSYK